MSELKLKACSCCGRDDGIGGGRWENEHVIHCLICDLEVRAKTQAEAIEKWNRRPIEDALQKRIAELEAAINRACSNCWAKDTSDAAQCRTCGLKKALKGGKP